ncbi:MAG: hypothetical protein JXJ04_17910 [Spirochaetales bacterium]|nr:hypothetical protein [Spirochaetales bacterium]
MRFPGVVLKILWFFGIDDTGGFPFLYYYKEETRQNRLSELLLTKQFRLSDNFFLVESLYGNAFHTVVASKYTP